MQLADPEVRADLTEALMARYADRPVIVGPAILAARTDLVSWLRETMLREGKISPHDFDHLVVTDDPEEAAQCIVDCYNEHCSGEPMSLGHRDRTIK